MNDLLSQMFKAQSKIKDKNSQKKRGSSY